MGYIYKIENQITHKVYIGQTTKTDPYKRFKEHLAAAKSKTKNTKLYQAMQKYGPDAFLFSPIEQVDNDKLDEREIYWISSYKSYEKGYNMTPGGKTLKKPNYCKKSDGEIIKCYLGEAKRNISEVCRLLEISEKTVTNRLRLYHISSRDRHEIAVAINKGRYTPIWQIDPKTYKVIKTWENATMAEKELGFHHKAIEAKKQKTSKGYYWSYANEDSYNLTLSRIKNSKTQDFFINKCIIRQKDATTNKVINIFSTIREATQYLNKTDVSQISIAVNKGKLAYGYKWDRVMPED